MRWTLLAATVTLACAGCLGGDDASTDSDGGTPSPSASGHGTGAPSGSPTHPTSPSPTHGPNATPSPSPTYLPGNSTGNGTNGTMAWSYENRTGTVSGNGLVLTSPEETETFTVANGTTRLTLNLTVDGDPVTITVRPPGCDAAECEKSATTEEGFASLTVTAPADGPWEAALSLDGVGPLGADYTLQIGQLGPARAGA